MNPQDTQNTEDEQRLRHALHAQARHGAPAPVGPEAVTSRARRIRRRRTTLAALSTAAVVALVVPAGLAITGTTGSPDEPPVAGDSTTELPERLVELDMLADAEPGGDAPSLPYLRERTIVSPTGDDVEVSGEGRPVSVAVLGDRWLVVHDLGDGARRLDTLDAEGETVASATLSSGPALSSDGTVAAYVAGNGDLHTITEADGDMVLVTADRIGSYPEVVGVIGSQTCVESSPEVGSCTVALNLDEGGAQFAEPHNIYTSPTLIGVSDVSQDRVLGTVSATDDGSCSALQDYMTARQLWKTCTNSFGGLSPDGAFAFGYPAYTDGLGPSSVSIVDMSDGRELVRVARTGRDDTHARDIVWESDSSVLMTLWDGKDRSWRIVRLHVDGTYEQVEGDIAGTMDDSTVHLPAR